MVQPLVQLTTCSSPISRVTRIRPTAIDRERRTGRLNAMPRAEGAQLRISFGTIPNNDNTGGR
ncbi:hypothetical protein N7450_009395 [Penicillium hetheringtonii]|uniref:Uncharacterized protein n=1 Tax=Penicillium hetheringtonii TaxID=911720 RepID=A0AAD6DAX7_9EURO|nr:hypothetical protein N7450_009395 [Penicillium hetheringtonii]